MNHTVNREILTKDYPAKISLLLTPHSRIAIFLSGGLDSSILLYWILTENKKNNLNLDVTALCVSKLNGEFRSPKYLSTIESQFGKLKMLRDLDNTGSQPGAITEAIRRVMRANSYDMIFTGVNSNPPEQLVKLVGPYPARPQVNDHENLQLPFMKLFKYHIVDLGFQLGVEWIFSETHTCTERHDERCHKCFACQERRWAFEYLNKQDPLDLLK